MLLTNHLNSLSLLLIEQIDASHGVSIPVFSIFDIDGLPVSLPSTLIYQDICLDGAINKYIAVTPNDNNTVWFLSYLDEYIYDTIML